MTWSQHWSESGLIGLAMVSVLEFKHVLSTPKCLYCISAFPDQYTNYIAVVSSSWNLHQEHQTQRHYLLSTSLEQLVQFFLSIFFEPSWCPPFCSQDTLKPSASCCFPNETGHAQKYQKGEVIGERWLEGCGQNFLCQLLLNMEPSAETKITPVSVKTPEQVNCIKQWDPLKD